MRWLDYPYGGAYTIGVLSFLCFVLLRASGPFLGRYGFHDFDFHTIFSSIELQHWAFFQ